MKISDMLPYERNARKNEEAVSAVAKSIEKFGLNGQIVLWRKDNPLILAGHTRVKACKLLGWEEIPDKHICFTEHLSLEEAKAFILADNKTAQIAKWNKALLTQEIKRLKNFDFSNLGFSERRANERRRTNKGYNLHLIDSLPRTGEMPLIKATSYVPDALIGFNFAKTAKCKEAGIHFFIDDYQFERIWNAPERYIKLLKSFQCVLTPDFSLYADMPYPMQRWNIYRSRALGAYWQKEGLTVIPTLSWSDEISYEFCFEGIPKYSTVAISNVGATDEELFYQGLDEALKHLKPAHVITYGKPLDLSVPCTHFDNSVTKLMHRKRS